MIPLFSKKNVLTIAIISIFAVLIFLFINNLIRSENFIYYGDYSTYFTSFQKYSREFKTNNFLSVFQNVSVSIRSGDYNASIITPLEIFGVFNDSRLAFILSIYFEYFISSFVIFFLLIKFLTRKTKFNILLILGLSSMYFLSPVLLSPMLQGEPAIGGYIFIFSSIYLYFKIDKYSEKVYLKNAAFLAISLSLLPILRRWFIFYVIAFFITMTVDFGITLIKSKSKKNNINLITNYFIVLIFTVLSFILFSGNLYQRFIEIGFGNLYSFYRYDSFPLSFSFIFGSIGYLNIAIFVFSIITLLRKAKFRRIVLFLVSILILSTLLFLRTQNFSTHHLYLVMPIMLLITGLGLMTWKSKYKIVLTVLFIFINIFSFSYVTYLNRLPYWGNKKLLSTIDLHPLERTDLKELRQIFDYLGNTIKKDETIYVLNFPDPENNPFFDGVFIYYCRDQNFDKPYICNQVLRTNLIDLLDGFPFHFFKADYVLIRDPFSNGRNQQVIEKFVDFVNKSSDYKLLNTLPGKDISVNIYKRINNISEDQINSLLHDFRILYPNSIFDQQQPLHPPIPALQ